MGTFAKFKNNYSGTPQIRAYEFQHICLEKIETYIFNRTKILNLYLYFLYYNIILLSYVMKHLLEIAQYKR